MINTKLKASPDNKSRSPFPEMTLEDKRILFETVLENVAEKAGDINPQVLDKFYELHPEAVGLFSGKRLELMMIDQALYCVSVWLVRPIEIEILLRETVDHHGNCLRVPVSQFSGLFKALIQVFKSYVPSGDLRSITLLESINNDLQMLLAEAGRDVVVPDQGLSGADYFIE